ncbi:TetR/AcrR family transcriptional regulator [Subtercola frigoramans]|uniref:AcrR family transcriptional regulator n=1 Tax=Subtercola frigoramans TaxID=120298 RepID=A0ABS2L665_9MICO|nr:TetR/AcrR family transcriptional regulator C-terminal domain-containing protein [Subtercola frigoramans]MBM7472524.1 AcrR family transcriptional regulator [Subtercola frigoramans]
MDDAQLLRLLWGSGERLGPRPGPKSDLTMEAVVKAGIAVADDRDGPALSMRLVATRLGRTPMALYSYVDGKDTLLRLMYDAAHAEFMPLGDDQATEDQSALWQVHEWTRALTGLYARHHWLTELSWSRPVLGPHEQEVLESLLRRLSPLRLVAAQEATVASALLTLCRHTGRLIADARYAKRVTGKGDEQWWQEQSAAVAALGLDLAERFPLSSRLEPGFPEPEAGDDPAQGYLERSARAQLRRTVTLLIQGAMAHEGN